MPSTLPRSPLRARERWRWAQQLFVALTLLWLALDGAQRWYAAPFVAALGAALGAAVASVRPAPVRLARVPAFAAFFLGASLRGGVDVAWRAVHPALPIAPQFARFEIDLPEGQPRTLMVSVLSLMPGTLSVELERDRGTLLVHALTAQALDSVPELHEQVRRLFGAAADGGPRGRA